MTLDLNRKYVVNNLCDVRHNIIIYDVINCNYIILYGPLFRFQGKNLSDKYCNIKGLEISQNEINYKFEMIIFTNNTCLDNTCLDL